MTGGGHVISLRMKKKRITPVEVEKWVGKGSRNRVGLPKKALDCGN